MLVWKLFLLILFATDNCLSLAMPKTKDKKDEEMPGNKTVDIALIKEKSNNPVIENPGDEDPLKSKHDYERIYIIIMTEDPFYLNR